ncbi:energy transducer TonB [Hymenobacter metallilatus]|uniref:energy transducer TonB n=1 Tax=Hymenobacter metallilatus TaxID=2493666 RepID=UPI00163ADD67|nr:energy transducer TonB [Hymenobacter metallilatus]
MAVSLDEDGLSGVITFETYRAIGKGGPVTMCEVMPAYIKRNKKDSLQRFILENTRWADPTGKMCIDGRVFVSFTVGPDGQVYRTKVLKGMHPLFDAEALRVVQLLSGHFSSAICGGVALAHEMVVPVSFFLNSIND